jgi:hypothetical protein
MKRKAAVAALAVLFVVLAVAGAAVYWYGSPHGPSLADVAELRTPRIVSRPPQKVLQVTVSGNPDVIGREAFGTLLSTYMKLEGVARGGPDLPAPRARWPLGADTPVADWIGRYAMTVPDTVVALPGGGSRSTRDGAVIELTTWDYGDVAEILHVGPYDAEAPTIDALEAFIAASGYRIVGDHEEEYLRGPGMLFAGDPSTYLTVIRYRVAR